MNIKQLQKSANQVSEIMRTLANPNRLLILCQLVERERSVGELAELTGMREAATSQQLGLMRKDRLVATRRAGQTIWYSLAREDVKRLLYFLYEAYCGNKTSR
jgi:DNA-binding transcriptional ArsR family regulator